MNNLDELAFHTTHSPFSDPGAHAALLENVAPTLAAIRDAAHPLVFHYRGGGNWAENGIAPDRIAEADLRYADAMLGRLGELADLPLGSDRAPHQRIVGCCRDFALLAVSLCRQLGIPARSRTGFVSYFMPGWYLDHTVAEVWDASEARWRLVDVELAAGHADPNDGAVLDAFDLPRDRFVTANDAWNNCRAGALDPERFAVHPEEAPELRSWPYLRHNLMLDLAALNNHEMLLWDVWGIDPQDDQTADLSPGDLALLDEVAAATTFDTRRQLFTRDDLRVPPVVTSYSPEHGDHPVQVPLRAAEPSGR